MLDACSASRYNWIVIRSFQHAGLEKFFRTGSKAGIQKAHAPRLLAQLAVLNNAETPKDMNASGWKLQALKGSLKGHYSVWASGNWRMTFRFEAGDAFVVDYQDHH